MKIVYNKAIRDFIPEIITQQGKSCEVHTLSDSEFVPHLEQKLQEEITEYLDSKNILELVDILEVIYRLAQLKGSNVEELEQLRLKKQKEKGGFSKNYFLVNVNEQN